MDRSPGRGTLRGVASSADVERALVTCVVVLLTAVLVAVAALGPVLAGMVAAAALYLTLLAVLGRDRMAAATMVAAFFNAPFYRWLDDSAPLTPIDVLIGLAVLLFLPTVLARRLHLPPLYWVGVATIMTTGLLASVLSAEPNASLLTVGRWLVVLVGLPLIYVLWRPSARMIRTLLWSYVAGHMLSVAWAVASGPLVNNRYDGLTHHANAFAEAGLMTAAIILYLFHEYRGSTLRFVLVLAGLVSAQSILMSGSRAAFLVLAVLVLMVPLVERSAVSGFVLALAGGVLLALLPFVIDVGREGSALDRLAGGSGAARADEIRESVNESAWEMFLESPLIGQGYLEELTRVHNIYLQVAAAAGIVAVIGYLLVLYPLALPLFGSHPQRRLGYMVWAYIGLTAALPALWGRTSWVPMALVILVVTARHLERTHHDAGPPVRHGAQSTGTDPDGASG